MSNEVSRSTDVKLGFGRQLGYGLGEFAGQFFFGFWGSYLSIFYTDYVGIAPAVVSLIFLIARIWDAVNDPMLGMIADKHRHKKFGRYRPWILFGAPVLAVLNILVWFVPNLEGNGLKIAYIAITYILAGMAFTAVNVPYMSLQSTLTTNIKSRSDVANIKGAFTFVGTAVVNMFAMSLVTQLGGGEPNATGFFLTGVVFSIIGLVLYFITFASTKEEYIVDQQLTKVSFKVTMKYIFGNKHLVAIMITMLLSLLATFGRLGVAVYYYLYCCHAFEMVGLLMVIPTLCTIVPTYLIPKLNIPRKVLITIALVGRAIALFVLYFTDFNNTTAIIVCLIFIGFFNYETGMLAGLIAPAIDDAEIKKGIRMDGTAYAMVNLFAKVASAIGGAIGLIIMGAMGYVANADQTAEALKGINISTNILPAIFCLIAIVPLMFYGLNQKKIEENNRILAERHAAEHEGEA